MDWLQKMNAAIAYIEANLDGEIDVGKAGQLAGCSAYHFQRVFSYMANTTLAEYIRRRRLTRAAFDLQHGNAKVIDVALKYGYDSPTSFTRAFSTLHGATPSKAKTGDASFVSYPPISFQITVQGVSAMNYRIENKDAFRVIGPRIKTTMEHDQALKDIPLFWGKACDDNLIETLCQMMDAQPRGVFGLSMAEPGEGGGSYYYIAVSSNLPAPGGMYELAVPGSTWAIFESIGPMPQAMQTLQRQIYTEWLPASGYSYNENAPDIEVYSEGDQQANDYKSWVWLPVVKK